MEPLSRDEQRAADFFATHRLSSSRPSQVSGKSPDLVVEATDGYCFYAEVKSVEPYAESEGISWSEFNQRLASHIRKASKQINAVNTRRLAANVLVVVSHELRLCRPETLVASLSGLLWVPAGPVVDAQPGLRKRRVLEYLADLDMLILLPDHSGPSIFPLGDNRHHHDRLLRLLKPG